MRIDVKELVPPDQAEAVWRLYNDAFDELRTSAVQRHVMLREEFDQVMCDSRVGKFVGVDSGNGNSLFALATLTNDLDAMPLISPDYFERRWPDRYAEGRIYYIGFVAVHPEYRRTGAFETLVTALYRVVAAGRGVAVLDVCRRNEQLFGLPDAIHRVLHNLSGLVESDRIDEQSYWAYEFPSRS